MWTIFAWSNQRVIFFNTFQQFRYVQLHQNDGCVWRRRISRMGHICLLLWRSRCQSKLTFPIFNNSISSIRAKRKMLIWPDETFSKQKNSLKKKNIWYICFNEECERSKRVIKMFTICLFLFDYPRCLRFHTRYWILILYIWFWMIIASIRIY